MVGCCIGGVMQMEREIRNRNNQNLNGVSIYLPEVFSGDLVVEDSAGIPTSSCAAVAVEVMSPTPASGYIEHAVSKMDTLAGVAIKYGVEVADIKKMNGLVTDLQMFALKSIQIPLPGRHPPSTCLSNGSSATRPSSSGRTSPHRIQRDLFGSFQSLRVKSPQRQVSPAMSSLQGYYGLQSTSRNSSSESIEMAVYRKAIPNYLEDGLFPGVLDPILSNNRKSIGLANGYSNGNEESTGTTTPPILEPRDGETEKWSEKLTRRRQKSEADFSRTPEMLLEDNSGSGGGFSAITGKHLALRPKAAGRNAVAQNDVEINGLTPIPVGMGDSFIADGFSGVRKSSSTPSLQDPESNTSIATSRSASKWSLKSDIQGFSTSAIAMKPIFDGFSTSAIAKPIFDGLPKPISGRKTKAALD